LQILQDNHLYTKYGKCDFYKENIHYLGHVILGEGIAIDPENIKTIMEWTTLKNVAEIRSFLGLAGYY